MWYGALSLPSADSNTIFFTHLPEATSQTHIVRSREVVTRRVSSGEKHADVTESVCPHNLVGYLEDSDLLSMRRMSLLLLTAATILLFEDTAMVKLLDSSGGLKAFTFQMRIEQSRDPDTNFILSGENATEYTSSVWPLRVRM